MFLSTHGILSSSTEEAIPFSNAKSLEFDGVSDYVTSSSTYSELDGQTKASFSMWLKPIDVGSTLRTVFQIGDGSASSVNGVCQLFLFEGNRIDFSIDSGSFFGRADISQITYGSWNHLLITVDLDSEDEFKCYVNGVDATTNDNLGARTSFPTATEPLYVGEFTTGHYSPFLGNIDEFAIWSGTTLTSSDATSIYNSGTPNNLNHSGVVSPAPTTYWRMGDNDTYPTITDNAGSNDGTMVNMTSSDIVNDTP